MLAGLKQLYENSLLGPLLAAQPEPEGIIPCLVVHDDTFLGIHIDKFMILLASRYNPGARLSYCRDVASCKHCSTESQH